VLALERAGAKAELVKLPRERLGAAVGENGATPQFEAAIWDTPPLASYGTDYLRVVFGSDPRRATLNYSRYRSESFDGLAARAARAVRPEVRARLVRDELQLLAKDLPVVPLVYPKAAFAYRPAIYDGWQFIAGSGILDKRSFLPRSGLPANRRLAQEPVPGNPAGGLGPAGYVALGLLAVTVALAAIGLAGSARRRRRRTHA